MKTYGLIGRNLSHSFSQKYFQQKFFKEGVKDCQYLNFELNNISTLRKLVQKNDIKGLNITIPYKEKVIPLSKGQSARLLEEANAYKAKVTLDARGDVAKFLALLEEHSRAPALTNQRLYYASLEKVFSNTSKILLDNNGSNNILYLPLDKISAANSDTKDANSDPVTIKQREIEEIVKHDEYSKSDQVMNRPTYFNQDFNGKR